MTKKGPLGTAEKFYVQNKFKTSTIEDLCRELDRPKGLLEKFIDKCKKDEEKVETVALEQNKQPGQAIEPSEDEHSTFAMMDRKSGATVMTPGASELADDINKANRVKNARYKGRSDCVTTIRK